MSTEPGGIFFPVSNQLSGGGERPPRAAGSEGKLLAQVFVGGRAGVWEGTPHGVPPSLQGHPGKRGVLGDPGRQGKPVSV